MPEILNAYSISNAKNAEAAGYFDSAYKSLDGATLEAYLAIAHAYEKLKNNDLAIRYYEQALQVFSTSLNNMDKAVDSINEMELINTLYQDKIIQPTLESSLENKLPQHFATPYLHNMFASKEFQQVILNYQELLEIHGSLIQWKSSLPAFELMLTERENSFESKRELLKQITDLDWWWSYFWTYGNRKLF